MESQKFQKWMDLGQCDQNKKLAAQKDNYDGENNNFDVKVLEFLSRHAKNNLLSHNPDVVIVTT